MILTDQLPFDYGHAASHAEADFIVGQGNHLAHAHVIAFPAWAAPLTLIEGPPSAGKSHLARVWAERAAAHVATPETAEALAAEGGARPLLVEDVDRAGYDEDALFHLLNQSMRDRRPLLMTARLPVADWPYLTDDLKSRARLAAHFRIETSDDIALSQMLVKLFADRQVSVDPRVIAYLASRMERSPQAAVALVETMDRMALARGVAITRAIAAEALALHADDEEGGAT
jgi:chromosomal replication initiation ATPase DnaA